jgi:serine/threonine-protein kinase PknG
VSEEPRRPRHAAPDDEPQVAAPSWQPPPSVRWETPEPSISGRLDDGEAFRLDQDERLARRMKPGRPLRTAPASKQARQSETPAAQRLGFSELAKAVGQMKPPRPGAGSQITGEGSFHLNEVTMTVSPGLHRWASIRPMDSGSST